MHNVIGTCQVGVEFDFLESILTERGILEESIEMSQSIRITDMTYMADRKLLIFDCDVVEPLLN